jgi:hypothetical protein
MIRRPFFPVKNIASIFEKDLPRGCLFLVVALRITKISDRDGPPGESWEDHEALGRLFRHRKEKRALLAVRVKLPSLFCPEKADLLS